MASCFLYFAFYFGIFSLLNKLILAHSHISFYGLGAAVVDALIAAKAVLVIESTSFSKPFQASAPYVNILYAALLYTLLALLFLYLEKSLELLRKEGTIQLAFTSATRTRTTSTSSMPRSAGRDSPFSTTRFSPKSIDTWV